MANNKYEIEVHVPIINGVITEAEMLQHDAAYIRDIAVDMQGCHDVVRERLAKLDRAALKPFDEWYRSTQALAKHFEERSK